MECVKRLALEPWSIYRARLLGGDKWFGWSIDTEMTAREIDALNYNTSATAVNKKAKPGKPVERPKADSEARAYKPKSVKDMRLGAFFGNMIQQ